jgi:hypothetical protein
MKTEIVATTAAMIIKFVKKRVEMYSEFMKLITRGPFSHLVILVSLK